MREKGLVGAEVNQSNFDDLLISKNRARKRPLRENRKMGENFPKFSRNCEADLLDSNFVARKPAPPCVISLPMGMQTHARSESARQPCRLVSNMFEI